MNADAETKPRKFYKNEIVLTVLSKEPIPADMELSAIVREGDEGSYVLNEESREQHAFGGGPMAAELGRAGSEPAFFGLDLDGGPLDQDRRPEMDENQDWLDKLSEREVAEMLGRAIDEDRISTRSLRRFLRETGIATEEAPAYSPGGED